MGVEVEQRELGLEAAHVVVAEAGVPAGQPQLVEREPGLHLDREGAGHHLQVELPPVAGPDLVEAVVAVGDHPGEDVEAAGRALRDWFWPAPPGQRQLLDQRHQVGAVPLQGRAVAQVDLLEGQPLDLLLDRRVDVRQEAAAQRPGEVAEPQVDAGRLDRLRPDPVVAGADPLRLDRPAQLLGGQHSRGRRRPLAGRGRARCRRRLRHPAEIVADSGRRPVPKTPLRPAFPAPRLRYAPEPGGSAPKIHRLGAERSRLG